MLEIAIMIEGQNGLTWSHWQKIAHLVEDVGFVGLFRSDHFTNGNPPEMDSLELWTSLTWLASNTSRIEFGPLVTPFSFRHPVQTARMASAVDDLSNGRLVLGLGAGQNTVGKLAEGSGGKQALGELQVNVFARFPTRCPAIKFYLGILMETDGVGEQARRLIDRF